ncbi:MAG: DUF4468 domain-containing protein [Bacteroidales bacterium]
MRSLLLGIFLLFIGIGVKAQEAQEIPVNKDTGLITFRDVVKVDGDKKHLFNRCISWVNSEYKDPVRVTSLRDFPNGIIAGKHRFRLFYNDEEGNRRDGGMVNYVFKIDFKDGRYRYTVSNLTLKKQSRFPLEKWLDKDAVDYNPKMEDYLQQVAIFFKEWADRLNKGMQPEKAPVDDSNW